MRVGGRVVFTYDTRGTLTAIRTPDDVDFKATDGREFTTELDMPEPATTDSTN